LLHDEGMNTTETLYSSNSYRVDVNTHGVEITNLHTGDIKWLTGADADKAREQSVLAHHTDNILAAYFGSGR
jgi:hypothetical protein